MAIKNRYPEPPDFKDNVEIRKYLLDLLRSLYRKDNSNFINDTNPFLVSNGTISRAFDPTTANAQDVANALYTLLLDLQNAGIIDAGDN